MKLNIFIRHHINPSNYYRIYQYLNYIKKNHSVNVISSFPSFYYKYLGKCSKNKFLSILLKVITYPIVQVKLYLKTSLILFHPRSILFIQREIYPRRLGFIQKKILKRLINRNKIIWDIDDNILAINETSKVEFDLLSEKSASIIVCHQFLKDCLDKKYLNKVVFLPTSDVECAEFDLESANQKRLNNFPKTVTLGWIGTFNNLRFLEKILIFLDKSAEVLQKEFGKDLMLRIVSDTYLEANLNFIKINNILWTRAGAIEELKNIHIGLMPLDDNEITKGKCAFKAVQYMGFGIPVIASDVGFNREVIENCHNGYLITKDELWTDKIIELGSIEKRWLEFSNNSRTKWLKDFNTDDIMKKMIEIIR